MLQVLHLRLLESLTWDHFGNIFPHVTWTLTYDLDLLIWPSPIFETNTYQTRPIGRVW